jgi:RNA polymerase sigma factor (TIGR02999 family)
VIQGDSLSILFRLSAHLARKIESLEIDDEDLREAVEEHRAGSEAAGERLLAIVYDELRRAAEGIFRQERPGHTLQPTALVHEAFLRLAETDDVAWQGRTHLVAVAARAMRRILVDHARRRNRKKRRAEGGRVTLSGLEGAEGGPAHDALDVAEALEDLSDVSPRQARVVELRFFGGLGEAETAEVLGVAERTVRDDWRLARAMLRARLAGDA